MTEISIDADAGVSATTAPTFEELFALEHQRLYRSMLLVTRNRHEAEDLVQDAFVRLWEHWDRAADADEPAAYLYRTAFNAFLSRRRRALVAARHLIRPGAEPDPLEAVERRHIVVAALGELPPRQRAAVVLLDVLDRSSDEAGTILGIRPSTVRVLASRGRAALRGRIGDDDV